MTLPTSAARRQTPPRWAEALLRAALGAKDQESVVGDLAEEYRESLLPERGRLRADLWYCLLYTSPSPRDGLLSRMPSSA